MFDPDVFASRSLGATPKDGSPTPASLVFFETDHGFALAHDPDAADRAAEALAEGKKPTGLVVARLRGDDHDRLLYERLGHPPASVYHFLPDSPKTLALASRGHESPTGELVPWSHPAPWSAGQESWRFESENEWPPLAQTGSAWAEPIWTTDTCASPSGSGRALAIHAAGSGVGAVVLALPIPRAGAWRVAPRVLVEGGASGVSLRILGDDGQTLAEWAPSETAGAATMPGTKTCIEPPPHTITATSDHPLRLAISREKSDDHHLAALDRVSPRRGVPLTPDSSRV